MFSMTKSRELDEVQRRDADVSKPHYGEDVKFYQENHLNPIRIIFSIVLRSD